jgi:hypothetical protein
VVRERRSGPEKAADEHEDQVHPVPVQDVADAALLTRYAGEGEHHQRWGQGNDR